MLIAGALCLIAAVAAGALGLWTLSRPRAGLEHEVRRSIAPTQLAAAVMLIAGGLVAVTRHTPGTLLVLVVCVLGAVGTLAVGSWQGARFALARAEAEPAGCAGSCAACTLSCH